MDKKARLDFVLEGPGVSPATAEPLDALDAARDYFRLLRAVANEHGLEVPLVGLEVREGSLAVATRTPTPSNAQRAIGLAALYVSGQLEAGHGLKGKAQAVRERVIGLPLGRSYRVDCDGVRVPLLAESVEEPLPPQEMVELRARLMVLGGVKDSTARFESFSEDRTFPLRISELQARALGPHIYEELDIEALIQRDCEGFIVSGRLEGFVPMEKGDGVAAWREWFKAVGGDWDEIEDVEAELDRDRH